jgi:hypothetical protein
VGPPGEQQAQRPAHRDAPAEHADLGAGQVDTVAGQQLHDAARGARQRRGDRGVDVEHQPAEVGRVQAVRVLGRVDQLQHPVGVQPLRQRQLHDVAGAGGVGVQREHRLLDLLLAGRGGQVDADRGDADLGAVPVLHRDVGGAARVVTDQDGSQARRRGQRGHPLGQLGLDLGQSRLAVEDPRRGGRGHQPSRPW